MKFETKIKSISQYSIRGTRLFPAQIVAADSNKSINAQENLSNSSFSQHPRSFAQEYQPEVSRFSNRHTTEIIGLKSANLRLSLDQLNKNRSSELDEGSQGNFSGRKSVLQVQSEIKAKNGAIVQKETTLLKILAVESNQFEGFKDLRIQKITSNQTTMDRSQFQNYSRKSQQLQEKQTSPKKQFVRQESQTSADNIYQRLYVQYREKYNSMQKNNLQMISRMKEADVFIQALQKEKEAILGNFNRQRSTIEEQEKKILKLQESIKINRNINEQLMKKERQTQKKIKILEDNNQLVLKKRLDEVKTQTILEVKVKYEEASRNYEKQIFQLKLKIIDQANQFEQSIKEKQSAKMALQAECKGFLQQISNICQQKMSLFSQCSIARQQIKAKDVIISQLCQQNNHLKLSNYIANEQISKLTSEIIRIDQQNLRLDQQNYRINDEYQMRIEQSDNQISHFTNKCILLERQKEELTQALEDKDSQIAQLNIGKNNALLQVLLLKNELKKKKQVQEKEAVRRSQSQLQIQMLRNNEDNLKSNLQACNQRIGQIKNELRKANESIKLKQEEIFRLSQQILLKSTLSEEQMNALNVQNQTLKSQIVNIKDEYERQYSQKWKQNEDLMSQSLLFKLQMLQELKKSSSDVEVLNQKLSIWQKQNIQLKLINAKIQEQKGILQQLIKSKVKTILELNEQVNQLQKRQIERSETMKQKESVIQSRQNELKKVEQQYLELIEGQLKKIQSINDNEWDLAEIQFTDHFQITPRKSRSNEYLEEGLTPHSSPLKIKEIDESSSEEKEIQTEISELAMKVEELTFVNQALQNKVQSLSELQDNSNKIILQKIKAFEDNIERTVYERNEIELQNAELMLRVAEITDKCVQYESKIQWLQNIYRQLESNLFETQQELFRSNFQYVNLKLMNRFSNEQQKQVEENYIACIKEKNEDQEISNQNIYEFQNPATEQILQEQLNQKMLQSNQQAVIDVPQNQLILEQEKDQYQIQQKILLDEVFDEQSNLTNQLSQLCQQEPIYNKFPQIQINIINVSSENDEQQEKQYPQINIIMVNSENQSDQEQQIIQDKADQQCFIEYNTSVQQQFNEKKQSEIEKKLQNAQGQQNFQLIFENVIKEIIEKAENHQISSQIQSGHQRLVNNRKQQKQNLEGYGSEKENMLDMVQ